MFVNNLQTNDCLLSRCFVPKKRILSAFVLLYKTSASGSVLHLPWYPFVGCQQRQRELVPSCLHPALKGCSEQLAVGGLSLAYVPGAPFAAPWAAQQALPVGQSPGCSVAQEKGEALLLRTGCRTQVHCEEILCANKALLFFQMVLIITVSGAGDDDSLFIFTSRSKRLCWKKWGWWSSACQGTPSATRDHCGLLKAYSVLDEKVLFPVLCNFC